MRLIFRVHAIERMYRWRISAEDVRRVLDDGEKIRDYPEDKPYPSRLVLGWCGARPIHVVVAEDSESMETFVITVYEPDSERWEPDFRRKRS